jgi:hypothetical protein
MTPQLVDLLITLSASLVVLACGAGAILVLPWSDPVDVRTCSTEPEGSSDPLLDGPVVGVTIG